MSPENNDNEENDDERMVFDEPQTDEIILPAGVNLSMGTLDDLKDDPFQARTHSDRNVDVITTSMQRVGTGRSIVVDEDTTTLAGHATKKAARNAGLTKVLFVDAPSDVLVARRVTGLTQAQKLFLAVSDNRATDLSEFDPQAMQTAVRAGLDWEPMFTPDEMAPILQADWTPAAEDELPNKEHDPTRIHLSAEQYALVIMVRDIVREELLDDVDHPETDEAKAIEYACQLFLSDRKKRDVRPPDA